MRYGTEIQHVFSRNDNAEDFVNRNTRVDCFGYQSMWLGDPKYTDDIAIHSPKLKLVISHAGNGFGILGLAVA